MSGLRTGLLLLAAAALAGCGPEAPPALSIGEQPIVGGEPDGSAEHMGVAYIRIFTGGMMGGCTGTLIDDDVVLTAAHCVCAQESATELDPEAFEVRFGADSSSDIRRDVAEVQRHPGYHPRYIVNDIALLRLSRPAPVEIAPIPFLPTHLRIADADVGLPMEFVGFGVDEYGRAGTKLHVLGAVKWICTNDQGCNFGNQVYGMPNTLCFDQSEGGTCSGDSGGPGLFERDGQAFVAAVTSYGPQGDCFEYGCSTKVDAFEDFISEFTGGGLGDACEADGDCVHGHCVGGLCCDTPCDQPCQSCAEPGREGHCVVAANGSSCSDGDRCNGQEVCLMGDCVPGTPLDCSDDDPCTRDECLPASGCVNEVQPDGFACGDCMMCVSGACVDADCGGSGCASTPVGPERSAPLGGLLLAGLLGLLVWAARRSG